MLKMAHYHRLGAVHEFLLYRLKDVTTGDTLCDMKEKIV
jgi:hypothetical protein